MATGAGKTFTAITVVYRLLKFGGARRVPWFWWIPATSASRPIKNSILRGLLWNWPRRPVSTRRSDGAATLSCLRINRLTSHPPLGLRNSTRTLEEPELDSGVAHFNRQDAIAQKLEFVVLDGGGELEIQSLSQPGEIAFLPRQLPVQAAFVVLPAGGAIGGVAHAGVQVQVLAIGLSAAPAATGPRNFKLPAQPLGVAAQEGWYAPCGRR
jgi:hypothetical protein